MAEFVNIVVTTFNNLFSYNNTNVTIIFDETNKIWFSLTDIFKALGYANPNTEIKRLEIEPIYIKSYNEIYSKLPPQYINFKKPKNVQPHMKMTNETGIYIILTKSKKLIAKKFRDSLYQNIIPTLREKGEYKFDLKDKKKLNVITKKLKLYQKELNKSTKKQAFTNQTGNGFIYILKVKTTNNGSLKTCYKIGYTANLEKRLRTYKTGNPDTELVYHENLNCNKQMLEKCIMNLNTLKLLKSKTEIICDVSLDKLKDEIKDCKQLLSKHDK
jgi:prophage antirepressor-like protein